MGYEGKKHTAVSGEELSAHRFVRAPLSCGPGLRELREGGFKGKRDGMQREGTF